MIYEENQPDLLSTRSGFNSAVRHIKKSTRILEALEAGENLGDILSGPGYEDFSGSGALPLLRLLLIEKLGYGALSSNPVTLAADIPALAAEFAQWKSVDLVAAFHEPLGRPMIANPKNAGQLSALGNIRPRELLVVYAGNASRAIPGELCQRAVQTAVALFSGQAPEIPPELYLGGRAGFADPEEPKPAAGPGGDGSMPEKMTPRYSVAVTNDLFHNGNVEAWKRIINAYHAKYPGLRVHIYYEGEPILNINSLFTWGKVKQGGSVQFAVFGRGIKDVSKLQRLLAKGASRQFEPFLQAPENGVFKLF